MKKLLSISFALLILLAGMHISIATHYCGDKISATKFSVSGELASCGMEGSIEKCSFPVKLKGTSCCKNKLAAFVVDTNYNPTFSVFKAFSQNLLQIFILPAFLTNQSQTSLKLICTNVSPPGHFQVSDVSLPSICVFRNWFLMFFTILTERWLTLFCQ